ncbi:MAG TPA: hypothetical protein VHW26_05610 [Solirubrobacteraceae bacterium]|nr:hypothetical protein [Solirubrobacteraceae bacterium]
MLPPKHLALYLGDFIARQTIAAAASNPVPSPRLAPRPGVISRSSSRRRRDDRVVETRISLGRAGGKDGYWPDLPLERDEPGQLVVDATRLLDFHPMLALRPRLFIDWHLAAGHRVHVIAPASQIVAERLSDFGIARDLRSEIVSLPQPTNRRRDQLVPVTRFRDHVAVEDEVS